MGYTWTDGELITATKLNNTGGGGVDCIIYTDSNGNPAAYGDFDSALDKLTSGIPIVVLDYEGTNSSGYFASGSYPVALGWEYNATSPNQIKLFISSSSGYIWTTNGVTFWD